MRLALTGKMRSGKDAVARHLIERYGFRRVAFGDAIGRVIAELFPHLLAGGRKPRAAYQKVGQAMREIDPDVWVRLTLAELEKTGPETPVVVTDLRQPNEYEALRAAGFKIIRVQADEAVRIRRMIEAGDNFSPADLNHETERHVDGFEVDAEITNNGTIDELYTKIDELIGGMQLNGCGQDRHSQGRTSP